MTYAPAIEAQAAPQTAELNDVTGKDLLSRLKASPLGDKVGSFIDEAGGPNAERKARVEEFLGTLMAAVMDDASVVSDDVLDTVRAIIADLDKRLSAQMDEVLHDPGFQKLEASWRGLDHLVSNTRTGADLKIKVLNVKKEELADMFRTYKGSRWQHSPLFKKIYTSEFSQPGGQPYGCMVGDFYFDHGPQDVAVMRGMMAIAAAAHSPFITGAAPNMMSLRSWLELGTPEDLKMVFDDPEYASWRSLREHPDAAYLGLAMPRFVSRRPYGEKTEPVKEFAYEERTDSGTHERYVWSNAAYAMAANITRAFKDDGWCTRIRGRESGGTVESLKIHTFKTDEGNSIIKCPTEMMIDDSREKELADCGFMPLSYWKNSDFAAFVGAQSAQKPTQYEGADGTYATANANLTARLPYMFAMCRFAHYLKCMVRDKIGSFTSRVEMETELNNWIKNYVIEQPELASADDKAQRPLQAAEVVLTEDEGNPGYYSAVFHLKPHYQLEGLTATLSLVSKLPSERKA